jgi:hypothetical protein
MNVMIKTYITVINIISSERNMRNFGYPLETGLQHSSWLKWFATSQKVSDASHTEVIEYFNLPNPSICTMAPGFT